MSIQKKKKPERRRRYDHSNGRWRILLLPLLAVALTLAVESLNRVSVGKAFAYVINHPWFFSFNCLIVLTSLVFSELFKHRRAVLFLTSVVWIGLGIAACLVSRERTQPFTSMDVLMLKDAIKLTTIYYTWPQIIAMFGSIFVGLLVVIRILSRLPKRRHVNYALSLSVFCGLLTLCFCLYTLGIYFGVYPRYFDNLVEAYGDYGFPACFAFTFGDMGVAKPSTYSSETVTDLVDEIDELTPGETVPPTHRVFGADDNLAEPNIIYVQLESLFDVNTILDAKFSSDPTPNFNTLSKEFPSGELYVASIGGGTANVEFEVLSGMNLDFFGAGEYPYSTVLQESTCETIAYNLRQKGYATTALHNHTATFYSRNSVYSHLGFEHFVSLEYMPYVTYTEIGWAEDMVLADEIVKAMDATEARDFVMAITVESHGKYDAQYAYYEDDPKILALPEGIDEGAFASYIHLISETDKFIGKLIQKLETYDEPVICVFYGDHLPSLGLTADMLSTNNLYASRYIVWNNFSHDFDAPNLQTYRLSANLLAQLDMTGGIITKLHQSEPVDSDDPEYLDNLEMLQYDLLYGERRVYDGENPYEPVDLVMGSVPIEISSVSHRYGRVLVNGKNFTESSKILIDGAIYDTAFVSSAQIVAIVPRTTPVSEVCVAQIASDGVELSRTETFTLED